MKHSGTIAIFMVVWAAVLFVAFVVGICIREIRFQRAKVEVGSVMENTPNLSGKASAPMETETERLVKELAQRDSATSPRGSSERGPEVGEGRRGMRGGAGPFVNMSEEERAQMRERFGGRSRGRRGDMSQLSEEERARLEEERRQMRERIQNMSEEERQEYFSQMRERGGRGRRSRRENDNTEAEQEEND